MNSYASERTTLNALFDKYLSTKFELRATSLANYMECWDFYVRKKFGTRMISSIKYSDVILFYRSLLKERHLSLGSVETIHNLMNPAFKFAIRDGLLRRNPCEGAFAEISKKYKGISSRRHALTIEQQTVFMNYVAETPRYKRMLPFFTVLLGTGCRIGEAAGLRWCDIDLEKRIISINHSLAYYRHKDGDNRFSFGIFKPKTEAGIRTIPMLDEVYEAFLMERAYQKVHGFNNVKVDRMKGFIFQTAWGGLITSSIMSLTLKKIVESYNEEEAQKAIIEDRKPVFLPRFCCHVFRHTFCTRFCENETNVKVIQAVMGHADIQTTYGIYAEVMEEKKKETFEKLQKNMRIF